MNDPDNFDDLRETLAVAVATYTAPTPTPLHISPWIAMSLLQKAIRRGRNDLAQRAAATLLRTSPDRLWRRLGIIAVEDVGLGDLAAVRLVVPALVGKRARADLGGEWPVASYLVSRLSHAAKCRAADDLVMVATRHPAYVQVRLELGHHCRQELMGIVAGSCPLVPRAIALMYLLGTDGRDQGHLVSRRGQPQAAFEALGRAGLLSSSGRPRPGPLPEDPRAPCPPGRTALAGAGLGVQSDARRHHPTRGDDRGGAWMGVRHVYP